MAKKKKKKKKNCGSLKPFSLENLKAEFDLNNVMTGLSAAFDVICVYSHELQTLNMNISPIDLSNANKKIAIQCFLLI